MSPKAFALTMTLLATLFALSLAVTVFRLIRGPRPASLSRTWAGYGAAFPLIPGAQKLLGAMFMAQGLDVALENSIGAILWSPILGLCGYFYGRSKAGKGMDL
jgi:hypothetical protein